MSDRKETARPTYAHVLGVISGLADNIPDNPGADLQSECAQASQSLRAAETLVSTALTIFDNYEPPLSAILRDEIADGMSDACSYGPKGVDFWLTFYAARASTASRLKETRSSRSS